MDILSKANSTIVEYDNIMQEMIDPSNVLNQEKLASLSKKKSALQEVYDLVTGLGGRLDSTNVLTPIQTIITEIHYDHTHILGESIEEITTEKCGIFKDKTPSITVNSDSRAIKTIKEQALLKNVEVSFINKQNIVVKSQQQKSISFSYQDQEFTLPQAGVDSSVT